MMAKQQKIAITIPKGYGPRERIAIAQEIIDFIIKRTEDGKNKNNRSFPGYSKEYLNSLDFKNAGKSKDVNLKLSGDMLAAIKILNEKSGKIVLGFESGTPENDRAEGNILGTYGQSKPLPGKKRDFLGITRKDLMDEVLTKFPLDDKDALDNQVDTIIESGSAAQDALDDLE